MKRLLATLLLVLVAAYCGAAVISFPWAWNYGDTVYGHQVQDNFLAVDTYVASLSVPDVSTLTSDVTTLKAQMATAQAQIATAESDIDLLQALVASYSNVEDTVKKLTIAYQSASTSIPFVWSDTGLNHFALSSEDVIHFRFEYSCYAGVTFDNKWGSIEGCLRYNLGSGTGFVSSDTSLFKIEDHSTGASDWTVIATYTDAKLQFIASFPVSVRAFGTCFITGK